MHLESLCLPLIWMSNDTNGVQFLLQPPRRAPEVPTTVLCVTAISHQEKRWDNRVFFPVMSLDPSCDLCFPVTGRVEGSCLKIKRCFSLRSRTSKWLRPLYFPIMGHLVCGEGAVNRIVSIPIGGRRVEDVRRSALCRWEEKKKTWQWILQQCHFSQNFLSDWQADTGMQEIWNCHWKWAEHCDSPSPLFKRKSISTYSHQLAGCWILFNTTLGVNSQILSLQVKTAYTVSACAAAYSSQILIWWGLYKSLF